ncbi:unnamed protein product [Withania somnifera]
MDPSNKHQLLRSGSSCNKIRQIVRLQQLLKKWKKIAAASSSSTHLQRNTTSAASTPNSINKFLKKTLSFSDKDKDVPKGCLAVCVGKNEDEEKRFVIPMDYLARQSFQVLLREAEEEFGFQQQGILKIPCQVSLFEQILKTIQYDNHPPPSSTDFNKRQEETAHHHLSPTTSTSIINDDNIIHNVGCCSPENHQHIMPPQLCS